MDQTVGRILTSYISKRVFLGELHSFGVRTMTSQFYGVKIPKTAKNRPEWAFSSRNVKILKRPYLQNSKSNQVEI